MSDHMRATGDSVVQKAEDLIAATAGHKAVLDAATCSSCGICVSSCPHHAIEEPMNFCCAKCVKYCSTLEVPCEPARIAICAERCDGCGLCIPCWPSQAIHLAPAELRGM